METTKNSYSKGITLVQSLRGGLNTTADVVLISQGLWLYAEYCNSLKDTEPNEVDAVACLSIVSQAPYGITPTPLLPSTIANFLRTLNSGSNGITDQPTTENYNIEESEIIDSITKVNQFIQTSKFKPPSLSPFETTAQRISGLFGGSNWSKEALGKSIAQIAIGVVNDMYFSPNCTSYQPDHWAFAAIHFAICSFLSNATEQSELVSTWKTWVKAGIRWWINFEVPGDGSAKFDPFTILSDLLKNVYTHIQPDTDLYSMLFHPSLRILPNPTEPSENIETREFQGGSLSDGTECPPFSLDISPGLPEIHQAVSQKSLVEVRYLVEEMKIDIVQFRFDESSPLFLAAEKGDIITTRYLLERAKETNKLAELLNKPKSTGATPLHVAAFLGHEDIVKLLLEHNAVVNTQILSNQNSPLYDAVNRGHQSIAELLLASNADPSVLCINGGVCMHAAAYSGSVELIQKLHEANATQLNARKAPHGETPIHIASQSGNLAAVKQLINLGCNVSVNDFRFACFKPEHACSGLTPWHCALFKKNAELLHILLSAGAIPDQTLLQQPEVNRQYQALVATNSSGASEIEEGRTHEETSLPIVNHPPPTSDNTEEPPVKRARVS